MTPDERTEFEDLERRNTRFIDAGLRSMDSANIAPSKPVSNREKQLGFVIRRLCWDLSGTLFGKKRETVTIPPLPILLALMAIATGSEGDALQELKARVGALRLGGISDAVLAASFMRENLHEAVRERITMAVAVWFSHSVSMAEPLSKAAERLQVAVSAVPDINSLADWVKANVSPNSSVPSSVTLSASSCIVTCAIKFQARWGRPFPADLTSDLPFHDPESAEPVLCRMMHNRGSFSYMEKENAYQAVVLPLKGGLEVVVILPSLKPHSEGHSVLVDVLEDLAAQGWEKVVGETKRIDGDVWLPQFDVTGVTPLRSTLIDCGCEHAFGARSQHPGSTQGSGQFTISEVFAYTTCAVSEAGICADSEPFSPSTKDTFALPGSKRFSLKCDRPFLFVVRHPETNSVQLCSVITSPPPLMHSLDIDTALAQPEVDALEFSVPVERKWSSVKRTPSGLADGVKSSFLDVFTMPEDEGNVEELLAASPGNSIKMKRRSVIKIVGDVEVATPFTPPDAHSIPSDVLTGPVRARRKSQKSTTPVRSPSDVELLTERQKSVESLSPDPPLQSNSPRAVSSSRSSPSPTQGVHSVFSGLSMPDSEGTTPKMAARRRKAKQSSGPPASEGDDASLAKSGFGFVDEPSPSEPSPFAFIGTKAAEDKTSDRASGNRTLLAPSDLAETSAECSGHRAVLTRSDPGESSTAALDLDELFSPSSQAVTTVTHVPSPPPPYSPTRHQSASSVTSQQILASFDAPTANQAELFQKQAELQAQLAALQQQIALSAARPMATPSATAQPTDDSFGTLWDSFRSSP
ncbi:putative serpin-like protein [Diplonema papillatum]|nr:putative serpin-like protein [Diplonema papillatum]